MKTFSKTTEKPNIFNVEASFQNRTILWGLNQLFALIMSNSSVENYWIRIHDISQIETTDGIFKIFKSWVEFNKPYICDELKYNFRSTSIISLLKDDQVKILFKEMVNQRNRQLHNSSKKIHSKISSSKPKEKSRSITNSSSSSESDE